MQGRRWRHSRAWVIALATGLVSLSCAVEDDAGRSAIQVRNETSEEIRLTYESRYEISVNPVDVGVAAGESADVFVEPTARSSGPTFCLVGPLVATHADGEVERLSEGLCWQEELEWIVDGDPASHAP
jgi:hypothetical protein